MSVPPSAFLTDRQSFPRTSRGPHAGRGHGVVPESAGAPCLAAGLGEGWGTPLGPHRSHAPASAQFWIYPPQDPAPRPQRPRLPAGTELPFLPHTPCPPRPGGWRGWTPGGAWGCGLKESICGCRDAKGTGCRCTHHRWALRHHCVPAGAACTPGSQPLAEWKFLTGTAAPSGPLPRASAQSSQEFTSSSLPIVPRGPPDPSTALLLDPWSGSSPSLASDFLPYTSSFLSAGRSAPYLPGSSTPPQGSAPPPKATPLSRQDSPSRAGSALWRLRMLPAPDRKVLQRDLLGCAPVAPARVRPPAASRWCCRRPPTPRARGGAGRGGLSSGRAAAAAAGPGSGARRRPGCGAM